MLNPYADGGPDCDPGSELWRFPESFCDLTELRRLELVMILLRMELERV